MGGGVSSAAYVIKPKHLILAEPKSASLPSPSLVKNTDNIKAHIKVLEQPLKTAIYV